MEYTLEHVIPLLQNTPTVIRSMAEELDETWTRATEGPKTWSLFDIVGHLIHCEEDDWIPRLQIILGNGESKKFKKLDRFAHIEKSKGFTIDDLLIRFVSRRAANLETLRNLNLTPDKLAMKGVHPTFGIVTAAELLSAWVVHDLDHIAQMSRVLAHQFRNTVGPWKAYMPILGEHDK
ncbi:MAG: hypothetical protein ACI9JN_002406 [Bacteroidia bacterium]|jgi:hypothetical protein